MHNRVILILLESIILETDFLKNVWKSRRLDDFSRKRGHIFQCSISHLIVVLILLLAVKLVKFIGNLLLWC